MTPEEYIEKLKSAQRTLDNAQDWLDMAIGKMQRRIETGYDYLECTSRVKALVAREDVKIASSRIIEAAMGKIEY